MARMLPIDRSLFFKLVRVVNLTARPFVESISKVHQLSLNEWRAMVVLAHYPGAAASEVAEHTGQDKMSVSRAIAGLHRLGRISKQADANDARRTHLSLSKSGQALFELIANSAARRETQLFGDISRSELAAMEKTIDRLLEALKRSEAE